MTNIATRTATYLQEEANIVIRRVTPTPDSDVDLTLGNLTAMIGVGGTSGILVAFSFPQELAEVLLRQMTQGIEIPPGEETSFLHGALTETINIIIGNALAGTSEPGTHISITPPVLVEGGKCILRQHGARFGTIEFETNHGVLNIYMIGPETLFSHYLKRAS